MYLKAIFIKQESYLTFSLLVAVVSNETNSADIFKNIYTHLKCAKKNSACKLYFYLKGKKISM